MIIVELLDLLCFYLCIVSTFKMFTSIIFYCMIKIVIFVLLIKFLFSSSTAVNKCVVFHISLICPVILQLKQLPLDLRNHLLVLILRFVNVPPAMVASARYCKFCTYNLFIYY